MRARRRLTWTLLDQGVSSATNFGVAFLILRSVSTEEFGGFTIAFATFVLALAAGRSLAGTPLLMTHTKTRDKMNVAGATGIALGLGLAVGPLLLIAGLLVDGSIGQSLVAMAVVTPGLLVQDAYRYVFLAEQTPEKALTNDLVWAAILIALAIATLPFHGLRVLILVWGISGGLAAAFGARQRGIRPSLVDSASWARAHRRLSVPFLLEAGLSRGSIWLATSAIGAFGTLALVGSINGASTLLGPMTVISLGMVAFAIPEGVRALGGPDPRILGKLGTLGAFLVTLSLAYSLVLLSTPHSIGVTVLAETWGKLRPYVMPVGLWVAANGASHAARAGLRIFSAPRYSLVSEAISALLLVLGAVIGVHAFEGPGVAYSLALAAWLGSLAWWTMLVVASRRRLRHTPDALEPKHQ